MPFWSVSPQALREEPSTRGITRSEREPSQSCAVASLVSFQRPRTDKGPASLGSMRGPSLVTKHLDDSPSSWTARSVSRRTNPPWALRSFLCPQTADRRPAKPSSGRPEGRGGACQRGWVALSQPWESNPCQRADSQLYRPRMIGDSRMDSVQLRCSS